MNSASDTELVVMSQRGDLEAFNRLVGKWDASLYGFVRRMLGNTEDSRDVCQEALLKAYLNITRLRDPSKFTAWLHHIALNLCRDWYRSARVRSKPESYEEGQPGELRILEATGTQRAPDVDVERADLVQTLSKVLDRISWEQRTAILLREYQGFTTEEIAQITGVPAATVRTRIFYGLKAVRKMMREYGITPEGLQEGDR